MSSQSRWRTVTVPLYEALNFPRMPLACSMRLSSSSSSLFAARMCPVQVEQIVITSSSPERLSLRVGARVQHAGNVAIDVVENGRPTARRCG